MPAGAQMQTYTFDPLIGMTSETDINNKTTYYEYDGMSRLSVVQDDNRHVIKTICYNYAGQTVPCPVNIPVQCAPPVITSATSIGGFTISVAYTSPPGTTSCRVDVYNPAGIIVATNTSSSCSSPVSLSVPGKAVYTVYVTAFSVQCPNGTVSQPVTVNVKS